MASETLIIRQVDTELLERQRLALLRMTMYVEGTGDKPSMEDMEMVEGIQQMLDHWSDERYWEGVRNGR